MLNSSRRISGRQLVVYYRAIATMLEAGVPLFAVFEFLSRSGESKELCRVSNRIAQRLVSGKDLPSAVRPESHCFDKATCRLLLAGCKSGAMVKILKRLAIDTEARWALIQRIQGQLVYPTCIAIVTVVAVVFLPPFLMGDFLNELVKMSGEPPMLTSLILRASQFLTHPLTLGCLLALSGFIIWVYGWAKRQGKLALLEPFIWSMPAVGELWQDVVSIRFIQVFAASYESGLPVTSCLELAASATGSYLCDQKGPIMKANLVEGGTLTESLMVGGFLPRIVIESTRAGENVGEVSSMLHSVKELIQTELEARLEAVTKLIEPIILAVMGGFVAVFALGCLLPIVKMTESL